MILILFFSGFNYLFEYFWIFLSQLGQNFSIKFNFIFFQAGDKF